MPIRAGNKKSEPGTHHAFTSSGSWNLPCVCARAAALALHELKTLGSIALSQNEHVAIRLMGEHQI